MGKTGMEVFGLYATATSAEIALDRLIAAGYARDAISLLMVDPYATRNATVEANKRVRHGLTISSMIGGTLGSLDEIGSVALPGTGPVIAAGRMMRLFVTNGVDDVMNALMQMGMSELEALRYENRVQGGDVLLALHCESPAEAQWVKTIAKESHGDWVETWSVAPVRWRSRGNEIHNELYAGVTRPEIRSH